jgi:hypothetical protein
MEDGRKETEWKEKQVVGTARQFVAKAMFAHLNPLDSFSARFLVPRNLTRISHHVPSRGGGNGFTCKAYDRGARVLQQHVEDSEGVQRRNRKQLL